MRRKAAVVAAEKADVGVLQKAAFLLIFSLRFFYFLCYFFFVIAGAE